ncbi:hypothetical protein TREMEDRAFT_67326 [Tremella mesenterica DSM 1558]|uniref:uncharacterized protein n=1 Tax=Tremella mesenterica (strain ATCC 24925 / CBS 8224 / DSM 1558 / NBRC 9311 / NRRL Y-6157 / RJB 2259-6 / UBC 559-6) TaxID=578456 RepID=UPI0003F49236|nr:uncharacterized protein TREMEDRAFT_67326 [Tremella mesenterica DSM 1558]EIW73322.1 hypothetical protein TREMEDRAFT_67326 [Tremella mesenterica DSM 1558]
MTDEELPPSKLGTKDYWDAQYEREVTVFEDIGDEGEVWFGESSVKKMRKWAHDHLPPSSSPIRILECGSGNGTLLLSFLTSPIGSIPQKYHLTGIDYSPTAILLSQKVEHARREMEIDEDEEISNICEVEWRVGDLLRDNMKEQWDLVLDKGTFDALCLSSDPVEEDKLKRLPSQVYPERIARLVKEGGFFLITSCNFTEEEIRRKYERPELGSSSVPHKSFTFGGKSGTIVCTVAFQKVSSTHVAIASTSGGIVSRAVGGTGNMAEVSHHYFSQI